MSKDKIEITINYKGKVRKIETETPTNENELYFFVNESDFLYRVKMIVANLLNLPMPEQ